MMASKLYTYSGNQGDFSITGYSSYEAMESFLSGTCKITQGEMFDIESDASECVISNELSLFNDISVGDTITLTNPNDEQQSFDFIVKGIYNNSATDSESAFRQFSSAGDPANLIYTSYEALNKAITYTADNAISETTENGFIRSSEMTGQLSSTYVFTDVESYNSFEKDVRQMGLGEEYTISSLDINGYENSLVPIKNTANYATALLVIVLIIGGVILTVLNIFNIRERKYEVGVLAAIGMKKSKIARGRRSD